MQNPVIVIGGGPAGLTAAYELSKKKQPVIVFEKDNCVGGISRTVCHEGYRFDIGGHRFFTKIDIVEDIWKEVLQDEFITRSRLSRIYYRKRFFYYPIQPLNALWGLGIIGSLRILASYLYIQVFPNKEEKNFEQWVSNRFGYYLYNTFFKNYTEKVWGIPCNEIQAEWASQRIKGLSLISAVINALKVNVNQDKKSVVKTLIHQFQYPRLGPGMMWERMAEMIQEMDNEVHLKTNVEKIYWEGNKVISVDVKGEDGEVRNVLGDHFISTMPIRELMCRLSPPPPEEALKAGKTLNYRDFMLIAIIVDEEDVFPDNWIYIHDPEVKLGRIQNFKNWSEDMVPDQSKTCLGLEYFCFEGDEFWEMDDEKLIQIGKKEVAQIGLVDPAKVSGGVVVRVPKAYPVYDEEYKEALEKAREFLDPITNLKLVGRNGMHKYNNQDHSMLTALLAVRNILGDDYDVWAVNADTDYHEEVQSDELEKALKEVEETQPLVPKRIEHEA